MEQTLKIKSDLDLIEIDKNKLCNELQALCKDYKIKNKWDVLTIRKAIYLLKQ